MKTEAQVRKAALACKKQLDKVWSGWSIEVWENLGWHWRLRRGLLTVRGPGSTYSRDGYQCWIHEDEGDVGIPMEWSELFEEHPDPVTAVRRSVANMTAWLVRRTSWYLQLTLQLQPINGIQQEKKACRTKKAKPKKRSRST